MDVEPYAKRIAGTEQLIRLDQLLSRLEELARFCQDGDMDNRDAEARITAAAQAMERLRASGFPADGFEPDLRELSTEARHERLRRLVRAYIAHVSMAAPASSQAQELRQEIALAFEVARAAGVDVACEQEALLPYWQQAKSF
jgi:hypothetical protein